MKRKVKKYAGDEGSLVKGTTNVRTRSDDEMAEDSKFGGYGKYMPKTKSYSMDDVKSGLGRLLGGKSSPSEDRPTSSGVEDYASMGKRAPAKSTWSGTPDIKEETTTETETESPKGIASGFKSSESKFERNDNEVKMPSVKKKVTPKVDSKRGSQSFPLKDEDRGSQSFPLRGSSGTASSSALNRAGTEARTPDVMGTARTRAGTVIPGRIEPSKEDIDKSMSSLADRIKKQDQENSFNFKPSKSPNRSYKSGGKTTKMASGGKTSSASSRGDGIAQRGKTKGRMC